MQIQVTDFRGCLAGPKAEDDDPACRGASGEIEVVGDERDAAERRFEVRQNSRRENPPDAAPINGKDAEVLIARPILGNAASRNRTDGTGQDWLFVRHTLSLVVG